MKNRQIAVSFIAIVTTVAIVFSACRKINESTELGGGLVPPVDNINTFDTTLTIQAFNDSFGLATDTLRVKGNEEHFLGRINNDPFFGKTDARMFLELKPPGFKFYFNNKWPDSLRIDSVVLVLHYVETYGDTNTVQTVNVYEIDQGSDFMVDTTGLSFFKRDGKYLVRKSNIAYSNLLGSRTFAPNILNDSIKAKFDTTVGQLRIRLDNSFGNRLLSYDSSVNGAYASDSLFRSKFKGFALQSMGTGDAVMGFDLYGGNTKLAIYYHHNNGGANKWDTTVVYFPFKTSSANANFVTRDYIGTPLQASLGGASPDPIIYIQNPPGTFATLKIPDLLTISNRTIHRAELIVEQIYHFSDSTYRPPDYLYLDASDPTITNAHKFRTIPYDLSLNSGGGLDLQALGVAPQIKVDGAGRKIRIWKFNVSRYVQHVLTRTQSLYDLRLYAPLFEYNQFGTPPGTDTEVLVEVNPAIVKGRIRLHGNISQADINPQRIRLRLVYSKL